MAALRHGDPARGAPRDPRSAGLEILPQPLLVLLGRGRRPLWLARPFALRPLGARRVATDGLAALGADDPVGRCILVFGHRAGGLLVFDRVFFPRSVAVHPDRRGAIGCTGRWPGGRDHTAAARRVYRWPGRAHRHLLVDLQRTLESGPGRVARGCLALFTRPVPERHEPPECVHNENTWIGLEEELPPHRRLVVRQISGAIARRIVCNLRPGETLARGRSSA